MILRVKLKNFLSFDDEVQFDMFPNLKRTTLGGHIYKPEGTPPLLKMAAVYGANGAGKSNLLKGINFLKTITTDKNFLNTKNVGKYFFKLKNNAGDTPMELMAEFLARDGMVYIYLVKISQEGILYETLKVSGLGTTENTNIFTRANGALECAAVLSEDISHVVGEWMKINPFASVMTINNDIPVLSDERINRARKWFDEDLMIVGIHSFSPELINIFKNEEMCEFVSEIFRAVGLGINNIKVETENLDEWTKNHDLNAFAKTKVHQLHDGVLSEVVDFRNTWAISTEADGKKISRILFSQSGKNNYTGDMDILSQSDGTIRLLTLVPALFAAVKEGKTVVVDELDHSIHPHLVRGLVRYFSSRATTGQLIFTTHQTCLLNQFFIRTDEVWLVEKKDGGSYIYSLNDYKIHNTINIEIGYIEGRYGAIPFIGEIDLEE